MQMNLYTNDDMIYALATPLAPSALAVIRISGAGCIAALSAVFSRPQALIEAASHTLVHGFLRSMEDGRDIDEVVLSVFRENRGYTGEESLEISCHGSVFGIEMILDLLDSIGMRKAEAGEFTYRAFYHGKIDLTRSEAVMEIVHSHSRHAHALALNRLEGALFTRIDDIKIRMAQAMSSIEVQLDYAEDDFSDEVRFPDDLILSALNDIDALIDTYRVGRIYRDGVKVVLAGPTNAGKSTLFNLLMKSERSIVSDTHGTTRDFIEGQTVIGGIPTLLFDTAGLRHSADQIEMEGVRRSRYLLDNAHVIVLLVDADEAEVQLSDNLDIIEDERCIVVYNKSDAASRSIPEDVVALSAITGAGFSRLEQEILTRIRRGVSFGGSDDVIIESRRQIQELKRAREALSRARSGAAEGQPLDVVAVELHEGLEAIGNLTGEVTSSDILDTIFSGFCVGK